MTDSDNPAGATKRDGRQTVEELRLERLTASIGELDEMVAFMSDGGSGATTGGIERASASISNAKEARDAGNLQVAWRYCHQARRFLLAEMSSEQRESHRKALRREAEEKLTNWRRDAVLDIIGRDVDTKEIQPAELTTARFIMDEHLDNKYFKLEAAAIGLRLVSPIMLSLIAVVVVISVTLVTLVGSNVIQAPEGSFLLFELETTVIVLVSGAVGAMLSNTLSVLGHSGRIPAFIGQLGNWGVRLPLGALSAFVVVAVLQSELLPLEGVTAPAIYGWSVAAGFSDQLLNRVMRRVETAAEK